jgi:hypothetical protein
MSSGNPAADIEEPDMRVTVVETSEELVDIAGFLPLADTARAREVRKLRRHRRVVVRQRHSHPSAGTPAPPTAPVEVTLVRSSRNRTGGGARARPAGSRLGRP